jgi:rRNA processing protein Krr1/Pno1
MASSSSADIADSGSAPSAAQQLLQQHHAEHQPTVEDVPDEELKIGKPSASGDGEAPTWAPNMSAKAAGKQKAQETRAPIDTQSHEAFPELGGPKKTNAGVAPIWGAKGNTNGKANGTGSADGTPRADTPASGVATPTGSSRPGPPAMSIPGRNIESITLDQQHIMQRGALKRPIPDIIKDLNRKSRANISMSNLPGNRLRFEATGPQDVAQQALKDLVQQIGTKLSIKVPIPSSARAHIIGKGGATIKSIQEKTGARVQLPKVDESAPNAGDDDEDSMIDVIVEGNAHSAAAAREAINKIAGERSANVNTRLRGIPIEFYPFIGNNNLVSNFENQGVQVRVPAHQYRSSTAPHIPQGSQRPVFAPAPIDESHIQLAGDRIAVQAAKAEIERLAQQLHQELHLEKFEIPQGRHQFIIGDRGVPAEEFFNDTGCTIILPNDVDDEIVTIIGPAAQLELGKNRAEDLALNLQCNNIDISRLYGQSGGASAAHARDLTRYLRSRRELERLEKEYKSYINTPFTRDGASPWELYSRDPKASLRARTEIKGITQSHPPSRIASVNVDPFFHQHLKTQVRPEVRKKHGVYLVVPETTEQGAPVLLVYEEAGEHDAPYQVPQTQPSQSDINMYQ